MFDTSLSLLDGLREQPTDAAWQRLVDMYSPLIRGWLIRHSVWRQDEDDLVQEILLVVLRKLPQFERVPRTGAFRRWLLNITINCLHEFWRSKRLRPLPTADERFAHLLEELEDENSDLTREWDAEHDRYVTRYLLSQIKPNFSPKTWEAFERLTFGGIPPAQVAQELGMSVNAVFIAKSRVMQQLRQLGKDLLE